MAVIEVSRERGGWGDAARAYRVLIDDADVGRLRRGQAGRYEVPPGHHVVELRVDWASSPAVEVEVAEGEVTRLRCGPSRGLAIVALFRPHDEYIRLERAPVK